MEIDLNPRWRPNKKKNGHLSPRSICHMPPSRPFYFFITTTFNWPERNLASKNCKSSIFEISGSLVVTVDTFVWPTNESIKYFSFSRLLELKVPVK
jgi:hypothetical protein